MTASHRLLASTAVDVFTAAARDSAHSSVCQLNDANGKKLFHEIIITATTTERATRQADRGFYHISLRYYLFIDNIFTVVPRNKNIEKKLEKEKVIAML